jgi:hypothetical protein
MNRQLPAYAPPSRYGAQRRGSPYDQIRLLEEHIDRYEQNMLEFMAQVVEQINTGAQGFSRQNIPVTPTISAVSFILHLTGTGVITNITPARDFSGLIALIGDSAFTINPGGNVATTTPIAVGADQLIMLLYSPVTSLWYPIAGGSSSSIIQDLIADVNALLSRNTETYVFHYPSLVPLGEPGWRLRASDSGTLAELRADVRSPPLGASLNVDVSIGGFFRGTVIIPAGSDFGSKTTGFSNGVDVTKDDNIIVEVVQVGSAAPGTNLVVQVRCTPGGSAASGGFGSGGFGDGGFGIL